MGIRNLLQLVKGAIEEGVKLSDYAGRTIGVDLYSWQIWQRRRIYRYVQTRGQDEMLNARLGDGYVRHCLGRLQKLLGLGVKLLVVLDGARLSLKDAERERRDNERQQRRQQAMRLLEGELFLEPTYSVSQQRKLIQIAFSNKRNPIRMTFLSIHEVPQRAGFQAQARASWPE